MKYLADENIPLEAVQRLRAAGLDLASASELLAGSADFDVLELASREGRGVITFDDLEGSSQIGPAHVAEAVQYRPRSGT